MNEAHPPSLSGIYIGAFHILDRGPTDTQGRAQYWTRHQCGRERLFRAQLIRKALRGEWEPRCSRCDQ